MKNPSRLRAGGVRKPVAVLDPTLDRGADRAEDLADCASEEQEGDDGDDGDEGEDQRVLREALAFLLVTVEQIHDPGVERKEHVVGNLLSSRDLPWGVEGRVGLDPVDVYVFRQYLRPTYRQISGTGSGPDRSEEHTSELQSPM